MTPSPTDFDLTTAAVEAAVRYGLTGDELIGQLLGEFDREGINAERLITHAFWIGGDSKKVFIVAPHRGRMLIDAAAWVEGPKLKSGPFKGKVFSYPKGVTDDD